jgi:B12-binding domain/radical SAM domain protein
MKRRVVFRIFPFNHLSFPTLLNVWEGEGIDGRFDIKTIRDLKELDELSGDTILIYSFMTHHLPIVAKEAKFLKEQGIKIAAGGPHVTGNIEIVKKLGFDYIFTGYGEKTFLQFGNELDETWNSKSVPVIYSSDYDENFDKYLPITKYMKTIPPLEIMRGCHWKCKYCQTGQFKPKYRSFESIEEYLKILSQRKYRRINFISPSSLEFGSESAKLLNLEMIEKLLTLTTQFDFDFVEYGVFPSEVRPESVTDESIAILAKYVSNKKITIGGQSGVNERLKVVRRGHSVADIEKAVEIVNRYGFMAIVDFIIAYPDETPEERAETLDFVSKLLKKYRVRIQSHHFFPISGCGLSNRFPSYLTEPEKELFLKLNIDGGSTASWVIGEKVAKDYFQWLSSNFPEFYDTYS